MFALFLLLAATQPGLHILSTLQGRDLEQAGVQADQLAVPAGVSGSEFATRLIVDGGLVTTDDLPDTDSEPQISGGFGPDGRNIIVYFASTGAHRGKVCRIRARDSSLTPARYRAFRWCASAFGQHLPDTPPPPVVVPAR